MLNFVSKTRTGQTANGTVAPGNAHDTLQH